MYSYEAQNRGKEASLVRLLMRSLGMTACVCDSVTGGTCWTPLLNNAAVAGFPIDAWGRLEVLEYTWEN